MMGASPTTDGRMAVGYGTKGIDIYSADGGLQQTVLKDVRIQEVAFLLDGRCVVRDVDDKLSLYTQDWKKLDITFETEDGGWGGLIVDCDDHIFVGYAIAEKIQVFTPSGGKAVREIQCGGFMPWQIFLMEPSKMMVVRTDSHAVSVFDQQGNEMHKFVKEKSTNVRPIVCKNGTILIATINKERDRVSIEQYTSELKYVRSLITDHVIEKTERDKYYLQEFTSGELALCTPNKMYIVHKVISPLEG